MATAPGKAMRDAGAVLAVVAETARASTPPPPRQFLDPKLTHHHASLHPKNDRAAGWGKSAHTAGAAPKFASITPSP